MIKYVPHHLIERERYDRCISEAKNSRIYAYSWYLDCVAEKWDVMVSGSYDIVMPLPRRRKYGINYIYTPSWTQQLGIFSKEVLTEELIRQFINQIPGKFILIDYMLNAENLLNVGSVVKRNNYLLPLNADFDTIRKGFNKNRHRISKQSFEDLRLEKRGHSSDFLRLYKGEFKNYSLPKDAIKKMENLLSVNNGRIRVWNVFKEEECIGGLVWTKDNRRITYLIPAIKAKAKKEHLNTFLINELIREYQNSDKMLDFEGSMVPGVAKFYSSFGAVTETYYFYQKRFMGHV